MNEDTSFDETQRQTINPLVDEINKVAEPLLKKAMREFGYELPLAFRLYNQIRFYEEYGKLKIKVSVASKDTLAKQFGVSVKQIEIAYNNLTNKYKLGKWVDHQEPVFRNVKRTWVSNERLKSTITAGDNYYSVIPKLLQRNSSTITADELSPEVPPLSENKKKISENKTLTKVNGLKAEKYGLVDINNLFDYWKNSTGYEITSKVKMNRNACNNLIKKHGVGGVEKLVDGVALAQQEKYAPSISDFIELQANLNKLLLWGKKKYNEKEKAKGSIII